MTETNEVIQGDCLIESDKIESGSVDLILTDPPYGIIKDADLGKHDTSWDEVISPKKIFNISNRILRKNGRLVLFGNEPFTSQMITSAIPNLPFSYRMMWLKDQPAFSMYIGCKKRPMSYFEDIVVFKKDNPLNENEFIHPLRKYFAKVMAYIGLELKRINEKLGHRKAEHSFYIKSTQFSLCTKETYQELIDKFNINSMQYFKRYNELKQIDKQHKEKFKSVFNLPEGKKYKSNVLEYKKDYDGYHPTQKPVALLEDLIKTYTNEGDLVVDLTAGSGSTGVAAKNLNRNYILIEQEEKYCEIARQRIDEI